MERVIEANRFNKKLIISVSAVIPVVVAFLILFPQKLFSGSWVYVLPDVNAAINSLTCILLGYAFLMIKKGRVKMHKYAMTLSLVLGFVFLLSYVVYHASVPSVKYGDMDADGFVSASELASVSGTRAVYFFILASHIILSIVVVPFVLFAFYFALSNQIERHKRLVRFTFPVWLYVSVSGVVVYFMIKPFYPW